MKNVLKKFMDNNGLVVKGKDKPTKSFDKLSRAEKDELLRRLLIDLKYISE